MIDLVRINADGTELWLPRSDVIQAMRATALLVALLCASSRTEEDRAIYQVLAVWSARRLAQFTANVSN